MIPGTLAAHPLFAFQGRGAANGADQPARFLRQSLSMEACGAPQPDRQAPVSANDTRQRRAVKRVGDAWAARPEATATSGCHPTAHH
jgi:hypothetical protein